MRDARVWSALESWDDYVAGGRIQECRCVACQCRPFRTATRTVDSTVQWAAEVSAERHARYAALRSRFRTGVRAAVFRSLCATYARECLPRCFSPRALRG
jgi:hypothetical protein